MDDGSNAKREGKTAGRSLLHLPEARQGQQNQVCVVLYGEPALSCVPYRAERFFLQERGKCRSTLAVIGETQ